MSYADLGVIGFHVHFPVDTTMGTPGGRRMPPHSALEVDARAPGAGTS
jgi:hypothetical protein